MAPSVRPSDGARPSDPDDLIFEADKENVQPQTKKEDQQIPWAFLISYFLSFVIGGLSAMISERIMSWVLILAVFACAIIVIRWLKQ